MRLCALPSMPIPGANPLWCLACSDSGRGSSLLDRTIADRRQLNTITLPDFSDPETGETGSTLGHVVSERGCGRSLVGRAARPGTGRIPYPYRLESWSRGPSPPVLFYSGGREGVIFFAPNNCLKSMSTSCSGSFKMQAKIKCPGAHQVPFGFYVSPSLFRVQT